jgi:hypothetical protein
MPESTLHRLAHEIDEFASSFEPGLVSLPSARDVWVVLDRMERQLGACKTLLARRVDESATWKKAGHSSAAECLAALGGTSISAARSVLETSRRLDELPSVADALRAGELSAPAAAVISDVAAAAPECADELVAVAKRSSYAETREACLRAKAAADPDRDATFARIHRERRLVEWTDGEGAWNLRARGTAADGALIRGVLDRLTDTRFRDARAAGERESRDAYAFDALVTLARAAGEPHDTEPAAPPKAKATPARYLAVLRLDWEALQRGWTEPDDTCEIAGIGPIPVSIARALLGESVLKLVITKGVDVLHVTHLGRGPSAAQRAALAWTSPICIVAGCTRTRLEFDHRTPWAVVRETRLENLDGACDHHHDLKTYEGWALVEGAGRRPMVPPDDPRHPRNRPPPDP